MTVFDSTKSDAEFERRLLVVIHEANEIISHPLSLDYITLALASLTLDKKSSFRPQPTNDQFIFSVELANCFLQIDSCTLVF